MAKSTKIVNPADKARREARKKELKKNKKQRQQVRTGVIEKKDPEQLIADLEKLDQLEFDLSTNASINSCLYKDKRKRLKETWDKILTHFNKIDPARHTTLKKLESDYELKHKRLVSEFAAIKAAQEVRIEDIFLPPDPVSELDSILDDDPLFSESIFVTHSTDGIKLPGCPPGLPPNLKEITTNLQPNPDLSVTLPVKAPDWHITQNTAKHRAASKLASSLPCRREKFVAQPRLGFRKEEKQANLGDSKSQEQKSQTSSTVIESQPIIFKSQANKFVPSSVRAKMSKNTSR